MMEFMGGGCTPPDSEDNPPFVRSSYTSTSDFVLNGNVSSYFVARGAASRGEISFHSGSYWGAEPPLSSDIVSGRVTTFFNSVEARDRIRICYLEKPDGSQGIGIYVRPWQQCPITSPHSFPLFQDS